jgi:hypothetical protein
MGSRLNAIKMITIKYSIVLILVVCSFVAMGQAPVFQIFPEYGYSFSQLNKTVYSGNTINQSKQIGAGLRLKLFKKISIGFEYQQRAFDLSNNIKETYAPIILNQNSFKEFNTSSNKNLLGGLFFNKASKSRSNLFEIGISGGIQQMNIGESTLSFQNPFQFNQADVLYKTKAQEVKSLMGQISIANTFFIKKFIGIRLSIKGQYAPNLYEVSYRSFPANKEFSFEQFCNAQNITQTAYNPISIIPSVGITIPLGFGKPKQDNQPKFEEPIRPKEEPKENKPDESKKKKIDCFTLVWTNPPKDGKCITESKLNFKITMPSTYTTIAGYEVYLAPLSDLTAKVMLFNLPYPSSNFSINSATLSLGKEYFVIVKLLFTDTNLNCSQVSDKIIRCDDGCLIKSSGSGVPTNKSNK